MSKWSSVVLTHEEWNAFRPVLVKSGIKFETSGYWDMLHVSFHTPTPELYQKVENMLEEVFSC